MPHNSTLGSEVDLTSVLCRFVVLGHDLHVIMQVACAVPDVED